MKVNDHVTCFTQLSRYALNNVGTDEKKQDFFLIELKSWFSLCIGGPRLCKFLGHGEQGIGTEKPPRYHAAQA
jgi:hypothetical protein